MTDEERAAGLMMSQVSRDALARVAVKPGAGET